MTICHEVTMACRDCIFWVETPGHVLGECHARPPTVTHHPDVVTVFIPTGPHDQTSWPRTAGSDWCGEFEMTEVADPRTYPV